MRLARSALRLVWLGGVASAAMTLGAAARDLPPDAAGVKTITDFLVTYGGKAVASAKGLTITQESGGYLVALDLSALNAAVKGLGVTYAPAVVKYHVIHQDDGAWRVERAEIPVISAQNTVDKKTMDMTIDASSLKGTYILDPAISWVRSGDGSADHVKVSIKGPGIEEVVQTGVASATVTTKPASDGPLSTNIKESIAGFQGAMAIDPQAADPKAAPGAKPFNVNFKSDALTVQGALDGIVAKPLMDLWAFWVAHPTRPELADNEAAFKALLTAALATQPAFDSATTLTGFSVQTPQGAYGADSFTFGGGLAAKGPASHFEERFAATGLKLPPGVAPANYVDFIPTAFDIDVKLSGFDVNAAGLEATGDMHLAGDAPPVSKDDGDKVTAKLMSAGPLQITIPPSHIVAPQIDLTFEGKASYPIPGKPTGKVIIHMRNFDKTMAALKGLGPDVEKQAAPMLAMAKGLAKPDGDALMWVAEVGADGVIKVNGLPLGKSPL